MFDRLRSIFASRKAPPAKTGDRGWYFTHGRSDAGVYVDDDTALGISAVWACVNLISRSIAMLPWHVYAPRSSDPAEGNERLPNNSVEWLLLREANPEMTAARFRQAMLMSALLHGNGYAEIERDIVGRPYALWPLQPRRVQPLRDENGALYYQADNGTAVGKVNLSPADMFHIAGPGHDGVCGLSVVTMARNSLGLAIAQERFAGSFIRNGAAPSGIIKINGGISDEGMTRLRGQVEQLYTGSRRAGRVALLEDGMDWTQLGMDLGDAEFLAQRRFAVEEVARWFNVPPQKIADQSKTTFSNFEQANLAFLTDGLMPWIVELEQEANRKLFRRALSGRGQPFTKINFAAIVRADLQKRWQAYGMGRQWGWLSVNDIRLLEDMEPIGPEGDVYLVPTNMAAADQIAPPADDPAAAQARLLTAVS